MWLRVAGLGCTGLGAGLVGLQIFRFSRSDSGKLKKPGLDRGSKTNKCEA